MAAFSYDLLSHIVSFLDDKTNSRLLKTCKYFAIYANKFGYASYIKAGLYVDMMTFIQRFCQHSFSVKTVEMYGVEDAHIWLPQYVERLIFEHCSICSYVNPEKPIYTTKYLKLTDYNYINKVTLRINWRCFPNLEELFLHIYDVDLTGIEQCKKLKKKTIHTNINGRFIIS